MKKTGTAKDELGHTFVFGPQGRVYENMDDVLGRQLLQSGSAEKFKDKVTSDEEMNDGD